MKTTTVAALAVFATGLSYGSGFKCESAGGVNVKVFNHVHPQNGTRRPAALVISTDDEGTLLVRKDDEIRKNNRRHTAQYVVDGRQGLGAETVILQIRFKEGREVLEEGETVEGQLILVGDEGSKEVIALECARYLKTE